MTMLDENKSPENLLKELKSLRERIAELEASDAAHKREDARLRSERNKEAEIAFEESQARDMSVVANMHDIVFQLSPLGIVEYVNPQVEKHLGYKPQDIVGRHLKITTPIDQIPKAMEKIGRVLLGKEVTNFEINQRHKNGTIVEMEVNASPVKKAGKVIAVQGIMRDISGRRRIEKAIEFERAQFLSLFEGINEIIYVTDPHTSEVLYVNKYFKDLLKKDPVGKPCYQEFQGLDAPCDFCTNEIILKNKGEYHQWMYHNPMLKKSLMISDRIIKWPDGRDVRFELAIDVTERKKVEEELEKKIKDLQDYKTLTVGRENKMVDLKREVNKLCQELGRPELYDLTFVD